MTEYDPDHDWRIGEYTGANCKKCGRQRVMRCEDPAGTERLICEKCNWDQADANG